MLVRMMSPHDDLPNQSRTTASFERETHNGRTRGVRVVADYQRDSTRQSCEMSRRHRSIWSSSPLVVARSAQAAGLDHAPSGSPGRRHPVHGW